MLVPGMTGSLMERLIHSRRGAGLQPGTSPQLLFSFFFFLTAAHSLEGGKKRKKKGGGRITTKAPQSEEWEVSLGQGKAAFKEGKARNQET